MPGDQNDGSIGLLLRPNQDSFPGNHILKLCIQIGNFPIDLETAVFLNGLMEVCLPAGIDQTCTGSCIAKHILSRTEAVQHFIFL